MKKIKLTQGQSALVDDEDFKVLNQYNWSAMFQRNTKHYCATRGIRISRKEVKTIYMHRYVLNAPKGLQVDHINHNPLDNRRINLRLATNSQNQMNGRIQKNNTSGFKGVCWNKVKKKWKAYIRLDNKRINLGHFKSKYDAAEKYNESARELFGKFAFLNSI